MLEACGTDIGVSTRWTILQDAARLGVRMVGSCRVERITTEGVVADRDGKQELLEADTVVMAVGSRPENGLEELLSAGDVMDGIELFKVGDCAGARKAIEAIREGFEVALKI